MMEIISAFALAMVLAVQAQASAKPEVVVVVGAAGAPEFAPQFDEWAERWRAAADTAAAAFHVIGKAEAAEPNDRERLQKLLDDLAGNANAPLWLVFIGHGTFDGHAAKFNLRGTDLSAEDLAGWLVPVKRPIA